MYRKLIKVALLTLLAYLLQATTAQYISFQGVAPNLALAIIAVITVAMGRKYAFLTSLSVGYLMEIMMRELDYLSLILYPVCAMIGALVFSDKSERKLEEERTTGRRSIQLHAHIRTPLCAALSATVYETVHLLYIYLSGVTVEGSHIWRALIDVVYTMLIAGALQFPIRWWLGVYKLKKAR